MQPINWPGNALWPLWQKILFRFFFVYFIIYIAPWTFVEYIPGGSYITQYYYQLMDWLVNAANDYIFHVRKVLVPVNGSGDTSYAFAQLWLSLSLAVIGCIIWSLADAGRDNYNRSGYWLRLMLRYFLIINCFGYGFDKLFLLQMPFPSQSQLATPLGDFLPMRFSWMFMGYSATYQFFAGLMEVVTGLLLLFRRTSTAGTLMAAGVFANVMMMNLSYDIPVKLFSTHLFIMCIILLAFEYRRINAFLLNKPAGEGNLYKVSFPKKWMRIGSWVLKIAFIVFIVILPLKNFTDTYRQVNHPKDIKPINEGIYEVKKFAVNSDTIPYSLADSTRWKDMIFEKGGAGSIGTADTLFRQRYRRGYFNFTTDTTAKIIFFSKRTVTFDSIPLFSMQYEMPDSSTIILTGLIRKDSVYAELKKTSRHFQLAEKQFHWLSEYNR